MSQYNAGEQCKVYDANGKLKYIIPHNPPPGKEIVNITEAELDKVLQTPVMAGRVDGTNLDYEPHGNGQRAVEKLKEHKHG